MTAQPSIGIKEKHVVASAHNVLQPKLKKVAVFTETYFPLKNGVDVFLKDLLPRLSENAEVILFAPGGKKLQVEEVNPNFKIYWVPACNFPFYEGYRMATIGIKDIKHILEEERPDVVHLHSPVLIGLKALYASKKLKIPTIATYHVHHTDYIQHLFGGHLPKFIEKLLKPLVRKLTAYVYSRIDIVTVSTNVIKERLEHYGIKDVVCIPDGIDFGKFEKSGKDPFEQYSIPQEKPIVLYVGRISFEKKLELLLKAFEKIEDATLLIVGDGPALEANRRLVQDLGLSNVIFTGRIENELLGNIYRIASVFVSPSDTETFGLTFAEAMGFGLPIIGVAKLGPIDIIRDGKNGFLVKPNDSAALADKIKILLANPTIREDLSTQAVIDAYERYHIVRTAERFLTLYEELA